MSAPLSLPAIRELHAGITPGEWEWDLDGWLSSDAKGYVLSNLPVVDEAVVEAVTVSPNDAAFIAAAPSTVARLLGIVERVNKLADTMGAQPEHRTTAALIRAAINWEGA